MEFYPKTILEVEGTFVIPSYQRGYRWGKGEVTRLLEDLHERVNSSENYCLQPIVVKRMEGAASAYELIDGQQRLTTLFLLMKVLKRHLPSSVTKYSLKYSTRKNSEEYLETLSPERRNEYIDFRYIHDAYKTIDEWIGNDTLKAIDLYRYLGKHVQILWYEADADEDGHQLFSRLNIGKIPLTNAELVKALFLNRGVGNTGKPTPLQEQIAAIWDLLERELHNPAFWSFLTNDEAGDYDTRLDLVFDLFTTGRKDRKDKYSIFFELSRRLKEVYDGSTDRLWADIHEYFLKLREWFEDDNLYHRAGYIVTVDGYRHPISKLLTDTEGMGYKKKLATLDCIIGAETNILENGDTAQDIAERLAALSYQKDPAMITKILLLFNVRTVEKSPDKSRFPFHLYKGTDKKGGWSLEHIHAQHSESLNKRWQWVEWLKENVRSLSALTGNDKKAEAEELTNEIASYLQPLSATGKEPGADLDQTKFDRLRRQVTELLSADNMNDDELHSISNLALLGLKENIALSNSLFETKRQKIIDMDTQGRYIPVCTRNVFMKYYTPAGSNQPHYWGAADRAAYFNRILETIYDIKA